MGFKYIIMAIDTEFGIRRLPIIFPDVLSHIDVAGAACWLPGIREHFEKHKTACISAGEIRLTAEHCGGGSVTLDIAESDPDDAELINTFPYFHGIEMPEDFKAQVVETLADATAPEK